MSKDRKKPKNDDEALTSGDSPVGYRKPPKTTRFAKGQSGNPRGRPRKPKRPESRLSDALHDTFLREEAYRPIKIRENGKEIELPMAQGVFRSLAMEGVKGKRLSQKYFLELLDRKEQEYLKYKIWHYERLSRLKRDGEKLIAEHKKKNLPPPENLLPHPDDIVLKPSTGEAFVQGPETPEELEHYEFSMATRDHFLLKAADVMETGKGHMIEYEGREYCFYLFWSQMCNRLLPCSLRRREEEDFSLLMQHGDLTKRERQRLIADGERHLEKLAEKPSPFASESKTPFERKLDEIIEKAQRRKEPEPDSSGA